MAQGQGGQGSWDPLAPSMCWLSSLSGMQILPTTGPTGTQRSQGPPSTEPTAVSPPNYSQEWLA